MRVYRQSTDGQPLDGQWHHTWISINVGMRFEPRTLSGGSHRVLSLGCRFSTILTFRALCFNRLERGSYKGRGEAKGGPKRRQGWQRRHSSLSVPHGRTQWRRRLDVSPRSSATKVWAISFRRCHLLSDRSPERREPVEGKSWGTARLPELSELFLSFVSDN